MSAMSFKIEALCCGIAKGKYENRTCLSINPRGIVEDYHHDAQIIMMDKHSYKAALTQKDNALCMSKFYAHILLSSLEELNLKTGDCLSNGDLKLRIIKLNKDCHLQNGCTYAKEKNVCLLNQKVYYLECINSGEIKINEKWEVLRCIATP